MRASMRKRVIICVPCLLIGGTEMHTLALARALVEGGYRVTVCAYYEHESVMVGEIEAVGADVRLLGLSRDGAGRNVGRMPRLARCLWKLFREVKPDFVHVQYMAPGVPAIVVARACGVRRVFATVHVPGWTYGKRIWAPKLAARLCTAFLCVSQVAERSFWGDADVFDESLSETGRKHFTIYNCADIDLVDEMIAAGEPERIRSELGLVGKPVIGIVARVSPEKGQQWLIEAMPGVVSRVPDVVLVVVGDGADRQRLTKLAESLGVAPNIRWLGRLPREEALGHYGAMDVVVAPSQWEGFGLCAAEAMAFSKPVVASDVGGLSEVVQDGRTGRLVDYGDVAGLSEEICGLLADDNLRRRLGSEGRRRAEDLFSWDTFKQRHLELYGSSGNGRGVIS